MTGGVLPNYYISASSDAGAQINAALSASPGGCHIWLPANETLSVQTQIDLDNANTSAPVVIHGQHAVLDGTALDADVIVGAITQNNDSIEIHDVTIQPNQTSGNGRWGLRIGDPEEAPGLVLSNVTIDGGVTDTGGGVPSGDANGARIFGAYRSRIEQLYVKSCVEGVWFEQMNAAFTESVIVRECFATFAMLIVRGRSWNIGSLYLESNWHSALSLRDGGMAIDVGALYAENNNRANDADFGIIIGEYDYPSPTADRGESVRSSRVSGVRQAAPANEWGTAFIGVDQASGVKISLEQVRPVVSQQAVVACIDSGRETGVEVCDSRLADNHTIDLTNVNTEFVVLITNVDMAAADLIDPESAATVLGGRQRS